MNPAGLAYTVDPTGKVWWSADDTDAAIEWLILRVTQLETELAAR